MSDKPANGYRAEGISAKDATDYLTGVCQELLSGMPEGSKVCVLVAIPVPGTVNTNRYLYVSTNDVHEEITALQGFAHMKHPTQGAMQ